MKLFNSASVGSFRGIELRAGIQIHMGKSPRFLLSATSAVAFLVASITGASADRGFRWAGLYVGGDLGWTKGESDVFLSGVPASASVDTSGILGGGHIGYGWQMGSLVLGVEADIWAADSSGERNYFGRPERENISVNWGYSGRGILGYAVDRILFYGTGGVSVVDMDQCAKTINTPCAPNFTFNDSFSGWVVGGGAALASQANGVARIEYLFADYGAEHHATIAGTKSVDLQTHTVRLGVSYKFGN